MKIILITFSFLFITQNLISQKNKLNEELILQKLEKLNKGPLPSSFFVIQGNTGLELYTNAPAIIKRNRDINNNQLCPNIYYIWKDDAGIGATHLVKYLKDNYYIDTSRFVKAFISKEIFDLFGNIPNSEIYYFNEKKIIKKWDGKYDKLNAEILPYDILNVSKEKPYLWNAYENYYHSNVAIYKSINDSISIELFDGQEDRIRLTNILTGKINKVMPLYTNLDYLDIYLNKMKNPLKLSEEEIKKNDAYFRDIKRTPFRVGNTYVKSENEIYIIGDVDIYHKAQESFYIPGEYNTKTITVEKGALTNSNFGCIIKTDTSFKIKDTLLFENFDLLNEFHKNNFFTWEDGFYINDSITYMTGYPFNKFEDKSYDDLYKKNTSTKFIYSFRKKNNFLDFKENPVAKCKYPFSLFYRYEDFEIFGTNKNVYSFISVFPEIYNISAEKPVTSIVDTSIVKSYVFERDYETDSKKEHIPFTIVCYNPLNNKSFLIMFYYLNSKFYLALFDGRMRLLERKNITDLVEYKKEIINFEFIPFFSDNYLNFVYNKNGQSVNKRIKITLNEYNKNALPKDEFFIK